MSDSENTIQGRILEYLALHPSVAWARRMNSGVARMKGFHVRFGFVGCSDILGQLKDGRFLALEVKRPGIGPTPEQAEFLDMVRKHNGVAGVVHSLEEVKGALS